LSLSETGMSIQPDADIDLVAALNDVIYHSEVRLAQKHIDIDLQLNGCTVLPVYANKKALSQLFTNLFENSYRYTDPGGAVRVELSRSDDRAELRFSDSTPGVPDDALPRLFDRLYRVDKSRSRASGGSGLGLAICHNIVRAHGGTIGAEHSALGGVSIIINLPVTTETRNE
jgi:two-component system sensor histidine kinase BaeS